MQVIKLNEVIKITCLSKTTIYNLISKGVFPKQINLGGNSVGWIEYEIINWIKQKMEERKFT